MGRMGINCMAPPADLLLLLWLPAALSPLQVLLRALRDFNLGKLTADDTSIFVGLLVRAPCPLAPAPCPLPARCPLPADLSLPAYVTAGGWHGCLADLGPAAALHSCLALMSMQNDLFPKTLELVPRAVDKVFEDRVRAACAVPA